MVGVNSMIQSLELPNNEIIIRRTVGCVVIAVMMKVVMMAVGMIVQLIFVAVTNTLTTRIPIIKLGVYFMNLKKLQAEKLLFAKCFVVILHTFVLTMVKQNCVDQKRSLFFSFYFYFWVKVSPIFKITNGQTDASIQFYFLDGDNRLTKVVSKLYCGKKLLSNFVMTSLFATD